MIRYKLFENKNIKIEGKQKFGGKVLKANSYKSSL